jgi:serine/threonine protein kinase
MTKSSLIQVPAGFRDSATPALRAGEVIDSTYQIVSLLNNSETGAVYEARDMLLDRSVALKLAWRDPGSPRLLQEARQCSAVRGAPAAAVFAIGTHNGAEYVISERVTGERLAERIGRGSLEDDELIQTWQRIVAAVADCHAAGMAVGDLSGNTILLVPKTSGEPRVVLGRFSMSQIPAIGPFGQILAPEIARGLAGPDDPMAAEAIDLYTLGAVAIELASDKPLFADDDLATVLRSHAERSPPSLLDYRSELPLELADLVDWLLIKEPDARPPSVAEVKEELEAIVERAAAAKHPMRILIVDGNVPRSRWLCSLARRANPVAVVTTANDGAEATERLHREYPDLLLIEATLSGAMNALELGMYARSLETTTRCKVAVLGESSARNQAVLERLGATTVPFSPSSLLQIIRGAVDERQRGQAKRVRRRSGILG